MNFELTEENFTMFAVKNYDNPSCKGMDEFLDDLKRIKRTINFKSYNCTW